MVALEASTGNAYAWGINTYGNLGDGTTASRSSPVSVLGGKSFSQLMSSGTHGNLFVVGIEGGTGNAYAWGFNTEGQLGNNASTHQSSPVSVSGDRSYSQIFVNTGYTGLAQGSPVIAIEGSTGNAYTWGRTWVPPILINGFGGSSLQSSPVSVPGGRSWSTILAPVNMLLGIEGSTGLAYTWGQQTLGQLGNGADIFAASPVSITNLVPNF